MHSKNHSWKLVFTREDGSRLFRCTRPYCYATANATKFGKLRVRKLYNVSNIIIW